MISSKEMYSKYLAQYTLSDKQLNLLQTTLLHMLCDINDICKKHNIHYMLSGGTLLGAIRHKGFIPWDDDLDIMMLRSEYAKFAEVVKKELSSKYYLAEPLCNKKYLNKMPKVFLKDSVYVEVPRAGINAFDMVYIDVFIIENVPHSKFERKLRGFCYDFAYKASSLCADYLYPSPPILKLCNKYKELKKYYGFRRKIGHLFSVLPGMQFLLSINEKLAKYSHKTGYMGIPSAISYNREVFSEKVFTEVILTDFCDRKFPIPKNYNIYLKNLYGDYMQLPPKEKREVHGAYKIKIKEN